jgi:hypothetical protein
MLYSRRHLALYFPPFLSLLFPLPSLSRFLVFPHICILAFSISRILALALVYSLFLLLDMPADRFISAFDANGKAIDLP